MNHIWSYEGEDYKIFNCSYYTYSEYGKQALGYKIIKCKKYFYKVYQELALGHNW